MTSPRPGEFEVIARYFAPLAAGSPMGLGLLDDAALVPVNPGCELVLTTDAMVAGVHFFPDDPPALIAQKLLRTNLSDLAAMGARALGYLLVTAWRDDTPEAWIAAFAQGLAADQQIFGIHLVGGDTVATPGSLSFTLTALGEVAGGRALRRSGARPGDDIYVSGTIGDAALGLMVRTGRLDDCDAADAEYLLSRHRLPEPRLALGQALVGIAGAAIDISDGLVADLGHLCAASGVGAEIAAGALPLSQAAARALGRAPVLRETLLTGGDDYELCLTLPPARAAAVQAAAAIAGHSGGVPLTAIGRITASSGVRVRDEAGAVLTFGQAGFRHF
mgnify:CR=1 FL=1